MFKMKYITRMDSKNTHGWWVRITKKIPHKKSPMKYQRFFADLKYQSKDWAFFRAVIYTDECLEQISYEVPVAKVQRRFIKDVRNGKEYSYNAVVVRYTKNDKDNYKQFSVKKYGEELALKKAQLWADQINKNNRQSLKKANKHLHNKY
jgi:hypothetical protein